MNIARGSGLFAVLIVVALCTGAARAADPLPSWQDTGNRQAIVEFVTAVTTEGGPDYVPRAERIAVFDNDGTLWCEQPMYVQLAFAIDRVVELAPAHPQWKSEQPFRAVLENDVHALAAHGMEGVVKIIVATHAGMSTDDFDGIVTSWLSQAGHPKFNRPYTTLVYQPMLELIDYLEANGFSTWIVSGGGIEFMRPWTERIYGIPPERVVGSVIENEYVVKDGRPVLMRLPELAFFDDKEGKPVGIHRHIGRRPIAAFGNSDGDFQMLEWTTAGPGRRLGVLVHHDDGGREYAYDRMSHFGKLDRGLDEAPARGWLVLSMKNDWKQVFPAP